MGDVRSIEQDPVKAAQYELVAAIKSTGKFGTGIRQEGSNGQEFMFHCPICIEDDGKGEGHRPHLRIAKTTNPGRTTPHIACRTHDTNSDYQRIRTALLAAGVPGALLGGKAIREAPNTSAVRGGASGEHVEFKSRPIGLGEKHPIPEGRIQRWAAALWADGPNAKRARDYLAQRGLRDDTVEAAEFGLAGNKLILPMRGAEGMVVAARYRTIRTDSEGRPFAAPWKPYPHPKLRNEETGKPLTYGAPTRLYGTREIALEIEAGEVGDDGLPRPVWLTAGEFDRLTLLEAGCLSASPTNGEGALPRLEDAQLLVGREVYVIYDCDKAGRRGALKLARALAGIGVEAIKVIDLDPDRDDGYDITDYFNEYDAPDFDAMSALADRVAAAPYFEIEQAVDIAQFGLSDRGMAEFVAARMSGSLKFVTPSQTWIGWNGKRWINYSFRDNAPATNAIVATARELRAAYPPLPASDDAEEDPNAMIHKWAHQYLGTAHRSVREHLTTLDGMRVELADLDRLPVINTPAGILALETGEVGPHRPEAYLRWITNGSYYPREQREAMSDEAREARTIWMQFIKRAIPSPDLRRYAQQLLGYSLLDGNPERLLIFVKGGTSTGKSVFAETVMHAMGSYAGPFNMSLLRDNQDERPRADMVEALTQRIIFANETSSAWHLHADAIKRMTGGDHIKARLPHRGDYFVRIPAFTPWVMTNEVPQIHAADMALDRRLVVIPFDQTIAPEEEDHETMQKLRRNGGDAVISWAVEGLRRWLRDGRRPLGFEIPAASIEAKFEFSSQLSPIHMFLEEVCDRSDPSDSAYRVSVAELYGAYESWCSVNGIREVVSKIEFGKRLSGVGIGTWIEDSVRYRSGIRLKSMGIK